jgi:hypothetical protein
MTRLKQAEPPTRLRPPPFMIGQDCRGNWVVQDLKRIRGGLFIDREAALRFVRSESGDRAQAFVIVSDVLELDISRNPCAAPRRGPVTDAGAQRRIA